MKVIKGNRNFVPQWCHKNATNLLTIADFLDTQYMKTNFNLPLLEREDIPLGNNTGHRDKQDIMIDLKKKKAGCGTWHMTCSRSTWHALRKDGQECSNAATSKYRPCQRAAQQNKLSQYKKTKKTIRRQPKHVTLTRWWKSKQISKRASLNDVCACLSDVCAKTAGDDLHSVTIVRCYFVTFHGYISWARV